MSDERITLAPVRPGDMFEYATGRVATVMSTRPGGLASIRIESESKPRLVIGDHPVRGLKAMPRLGHAKPIDGFFPFAIQGETSQVEPCRCGGATCSDEVGDLFRIICQECGASGPEHAAFWDAVRGWNALAALGATP